MKRFAFWFVAGLVALSIVRDGRRHDRHAPHRVVVINDGDRGASRTIVASRGDEFDDLREATEEAREDLREAERDVRRAAREAAEDAREAANDARKAAIEAAEDLRKAANEVRGQARVYVEGLPVPVVPGSRVTEARSEAPKRGHVRIHVSRSSKPKPPAKKAEPKVEPIKVVGRISATEARAKEDARLQLVKTVRERIGTAVPSSWPIPDPLLDRMVVGEPEVTKVEKDYGTMYEATLVVDAAPERFAAITEAHRHEERLKRLAVLGGGLAFLLVGLGTFSGYLRANEATKGYYTNKLRLAAAAGLGATGFAIYQALT